MIESFPSFLFDPLPSSFVLRTEAALFVILALRRFYKGPLWQIDLQFLGLPLFFSLFLVPTNHVLYSVLRSLQLAVLLLTLIALYLFPAVPHLEKPSGPFSVGTFWATFDDAERARTICCQLWYPSCLISGEKKWEKHRAPFWGPFSLPLTRVLCQRFGMPSFLLDHLQHVPTPCIRDAPLVSSPLHLPVIFSSHGLYGFKGDRTTFSMEWASRGYVVISVEHPGDSALSVLPDERLIRCESDLPVGVDELAFRQKGLETRTLDFLKVINFFVHLQSESSPELLCHLDQALSAHSSALHHLELLSGKQLISHLRHRLDLDHISATGHSFGGTTAIYAALRLPFIRTVVAMDPWLWPLSSLLQDIPPLVASDSQEEREEGPTQHRLNLSRVCVLIVAADEWDVGIKQKPWREIVVKNSSRHSKSLLIKGTQHHNFNDLPILARAWLGRLLKLIGKSDPIEAHSVINKLSRFFFDRRFESENDPDDHDNPLSSLREKFLLEFSNE